MNINHNSPEYKLYSDCSGVEYYIKRDDLLPEFFGGNKVRKNSFIISSMEKIPDVIITNGGAESNHARVCSLIARKIGAESHLVLHGCKASSEYYNGNDFIISCAGSSVSYVSPEGIAEEISSQKSYYESLGKTVEVIPGGAHSLEGAEAYLIAVDELKVEPDYIFFASGTGATQAGITAGIKRKGWNTKVIGISVAREKRRGTDAIYEIYSLLCDKYNIEHSKSDIIFLDDYRFGGYSSFNEQLDGFIKETIANQSIPLDPVYTAKAYYGMISEMSKKSVKRGTKVLFWHTGGFLNLQATKAI